MHKVYIVGQAFKSSFVTMFSRRDGWQVVNTPEEADFLQFTGGADISPALYSEQKHPTTSFFEHRDREEVEAYNTYLGKKNMLGVCRGAQLFCALNGGTLYQDVDHHTTRHMVIDVETESSILVSSIHHQMMRPGVGAKVLAVAVESANKRFMRGNEEVVHYGPAKGGELPDVEAVFWPHTKSFGFQPHPEFGPDSCTDYYFNLIERCFK